jgi:DNA-directed RNA polymerase beta subunit
MVLRSFQRGAWLEFGIDPGEILFVRVDKRARSSLTLIRALGFSNDVEILELFDNHSYIQAPWKEKQLQTPKKRSWKFSGDFVPVSHQPKKILEIL